MTGCRADGVRGEIRARTADRRGVRPGTCPRRCRTTGQDSAANHEHVEAAETGFVGSLPPSDHPGLPTLPNKRFLAVDKARHPGPTCIDTTVTAPGVTPRAVLTHSPTLHSAQSRRFDQTLAKARKRLAELQARPARGNTRKDRNGVEAGIAAIVKPAG